MLSYFEKRSPIFWAIIIPMLILIVGALDFFTGHEISFSLFYLLPASLATWFVGKRTGILASITCACVWFYADVTPDHHYSNAFLPFWNTGVRFGFFIIVTLLLSAQKKAFDHEQVMARTDSLTGAVNTGYFFKLLQKEIDQSHKTNHSFTVSYLDIDNFKMVNDRFGHSTGDQVLITIVHQAKGLLRRTDVVARLGGDEFALLLPETDQTTAQQIIHRIQSNLLGEMQQNGWPVTFSIGVITCVGNVPCSADELIKHADTLMYSVKNQGKNSVRYLQTAD